MYYTIKPRIIVDFGEKVVGSANLTTVTDGPRYFQRMYNQELLDNAPVFDYLFLMTTDWIRPETWEWLLQDIHTFTGGDIPIQGWLVSEYFKQVLEQFIIPPKHRFYRAKLKYQGKKLDYFIFHILWPDLEKMVVFEKLRFNLNPPFSTEIEGTYDQIIHSMEELQEVRLQNMKKSRHRMSINSITINGGFDFLPLWGVSADTIISEKLKTAIEQAKIEGVELAPAPFEVIVI
jgi:hypothetical protein